MSASALVPKLAFAASSVSPGDESTPNVNANADADAAKETTEMGGIPLLPESSGDKNLRSIKLGESIAMEGMGPIIINTDGTTRSIANWDDMSPQEKEVAWRRIAKRNQTRREALLKQQENTKEEL
eukprot:CAMPEP_0198301226 /NCGR_PEP_ID=MMETSP1449-20131203/50782_1 /TAXON_ID=420275 /ORGANISM="Attheya septentrionalis, Strain CCMP2084" /LENGTH=125 /DNA_ID=CAMNT_0044003245 /DNA_START=143 /DNA_END=520 /DNA_ORIENTATION=-